MIQLLVKGLEKEEKSDEIPPRSWYCAGKKGFPTHNVQQWKLWGGEAGEGGQGCGQASLLTCCWGWGDLGIDHEFTQKCL